MKKRLVFLFLLIAISTICKSQDTIRRNIPLLKESAQVDSLINSVNNISGNSKASKNDSCILLYLTEDIRRNFIQGLHMTNYKKIVYSFADFEKDKSVGYFQFNNYLIFVYGDKFMKQFFTYSKDRKEFTFIRPTTEKYFDMIRHYLCWAVFYDNEHLNYGVH
jgi:hypothetical protein